MNNTNGLIAERSKKSIAGAMLKVMNTYDYKEIGYSDAAEPPVRCGVSHLSGQT